VETFREFFILCGVIKIDYLELRVTRLEITRARHVYILMNSVTIALLKD
jgi:hypothetical protein